MPGVQHKPILGRFVVALLAWLGLVLMPTNSVLAAEDTTPPELTSLGFTPELIRTSVGPAEVTIGFTATDDSSGVIYFEAAFRDPSGVFSQSVSAKFDPTLSTKATAKVTFPRFSNAGSWTLTLVLLSDAAGNTLILNTDQLISRGIPTTLQVESLQDTVSPQLTALDFAPREIDTSDGPADIQVRYTATDDVSGVSYLEVGFVSPSGALRRSGSVKLAEGATLASGSIAITFPRLCEAGRWTLSFVLLADSAGNTLILDAPGIAQSAFPTSLEVTSASDTVRPDLVSLRFAPNSLDTRRGPATLEVDFSATDNLSGVSSFELVFAGPSGSAKQRGSVVFSPQKAVTKRVSISFPRSSEPGAWILETAILADAAGNTLVLDAGELTARAGTLQVR
jgi:hypothetical protein